MPTYEIEQYELHAMKYRVEAATEAEAIAKLFQGEAELCRELPRCVRARQGRLHHLTRPNPRVGWA